MSGWLPISTFLSVYLLAECLFLAKSKKSMISLVSVFVVRCHAGRGFFRLSEPAL